MFSKESLWCLSMETPHVNHHSADQLVSLIKKNTEDTFPSITTSSLYVDSCPHCAICWSRASLKNRFFMAYTEVALPSLREKKHIHVTSVLTEFH